MCTVVWVRGFSFSFFFLGDTKRQTQSSRRVGNSCWQREVQWFSLWVLIVLANEFARVWTSFEVVVYRVLVNWSGAVVNCPGVRRVGGTCCTWGCRASRGLRAVSVCLTRCHIPTRSIEDLHHPTPDQNICVKTILMILAWLKGSNNTFLGKILDGLP